MKHTHKKQKGSFLSIIKTPQGILTLSFLLLVPFSIVLFSQQQQQDSEKQVHAATTLTHFTGAFSVLSNFSTAAGAGVGAALNYGYNPVAGDTRSSDLQAANMQIIDQMPDKYLRQFDQDDNMTNLIDSLTTHLQAVQNNSQIIAYWILDDWSKDGTAKQALQQMTSLIHQYTPGKPSICGFSGNSGNLAGKTQNFSPQGCDMVAPYIYPNSDGDWTLNTVLPDIEAGLKSQGWDINTTPLVGVPQSYGGANNYAVPTAQQIETETKAFCEKGATGIIFYDFDTGQNPLNNADLLQGVKNGLSDCHTIWGTAGTTTTTAGVSPQVSSPQVSGAIQTSPVVSPPTLSPPTLFCMGSCPSVAPSLDQTQGNIAISGIPSTGTTATGGFSMSSLMAMIQNMISGMMGGMGFGSTGGTTGGVNMNNVSNGNITMPNIGGTGTTTGGGGVGGLTGGIGNMMSGLGNILGL